uniref:Serine protease n=1 Tax=Roseihalotalea indica TaxID=2867963 RepID=A0AA49GLY5_9BACT|nr:hypothetical protein K4G66_30000 [Tunicatimonas sp. TK19036]
MTNNEGPLGLDRLRELNPEPPQRKPPRSIHVNLAAFNLPDSVEPRIEKDWSDPSAYRVVADLPGEPVELESHREVVKTHLYDRLPAQELDTSIFEQFSKVERIDGNRLPYAPMQFIPQVSQLDMEIAERFRKRGDGEDRPTNIFGTDDRYIYQDSSFPWRTVGRVWTQNGACAGCTIGPRLVLTASHCINWLSGGGTGWVKFSPAYYNGNGPWGEFYATRVIYWNKAMGGLTDLETAFDYVVLVMNDYVGNMVGYPGYRSYSSSWNGDAVWQHMGYPGDLTSTQRPAFQGNCSVSSTSSESLSGQSGLVMGHFNDATGGHSGGPIWGWWNGEAWPRVVGVQSAEASVPAFNTSGDNEFGGGAALSALISYARSNYP